MFGPDKSIHKFSTFHALEHVDDVERDKKRFGYRHSKSALQSKSSLSFL